MPKLFAFVLLPGACVWRLWRLAVLPFALLDAGATRKSRCVCFGAAPRSSDGGFGWPAWGEHPFSWGLGNHKTFVCEKPACPFSNRNECTS